jgi:hypothetical protein
MVPRSVSECARQSTVVYRPVAKVLVSGLMRVCVDALRVPVGVWGTKGRGFESRQPDYESAGQERRRTLVARLRTLLRHGLVTVKTSVPDG